MFILSYLLKFVFLKIYPSLTARYSEAIEAEPSAGARFLEAARRREATVGVDVQQGGWAPEEDDGRLRWAFAEARRLLRRYSGLREALQERMAVA